MSAKLSQKFLFDVSFDGPPDARARGPVTPAEPRVGRAELAAAEAAAHAQGHAAGTAEAVAAHQHRVAAALDALGEHAAMLLADRGAAQRDAELLAIELTRTIVGKLFPALTRKNGLAEIAALVTQCMREAVDEPRLVLRVPDALFEAAQQQIAPLAASTGYPGKLVILGDEALAGSDCRIEWADGGAERDTARTRQEIDSTLALACARLDNPEPPQPAAPVLKN
jgi:flagellar assembly protein FliH